MNLNGDYLSDALAAQVGGIGIAPGGNINYKTGHAIFEVCCHIWVYFHSQTYPMIAAGHFVDNMPPALAFVVQLVA